MFDITIDYFNSVMRAMPLIIMISSIIEAIQGYEYYIFPISLILTELISRIFKFISKWLCGNYGLRPLGAKNCGVFVTPNNCNKPAISYGMPSGHAQFMWTAAIYQFLMNKRASIIYIILALLVSLSRFYLGCHSVDQIIIGSILGIFVGYFTFFFYN